MKNHTILIATILLIISPVYSAAEDFLGAPVIPEGKTIQKTKARLELLSDLTHDRVVMFYQEALKEEKDIKFRDWKDATYIEDDGKRKWHSVTISKGDEIGTTITIVKDSWTWIIGTLILRYIGVFVVLLILFLGITISGAIISRIIGRVEKKKD